MDILSEKRRNKRGFQGKRTKKAKQALDILKLPEQERRAYERYQDDLHYQASMVESTYTAGINKSMKKGRKEGIKKGVQKRNNEIASHLLAANILDIQTIAEITGLTLQEVEKLKAG